MTNFDGAPIVNYIGSIPGASQGLIADQPAAGYVAGDWYLATDQKKLYRWTGSAWVVVLDGSGGGGTGTLQTVTDAGNTTTNVLVVFDGFGNKTTMAATRFTFVAGVHTMEVLMATSPASSHQVLFRDISGTVALLSDITGSGNLQAVTTLGNTTTNDIIVEDGTSQEATLHADGRYATINATVISGANQPIGQLVADKVTGTSYAIFGDSAASRFVKFIFNSDAPPSASTNINFRTPGGTVTVAFLSDIPATSTLQVVTTAGNTSTNNIILQGAAYQFSVGGFLLSLTAPAITAARSVVFRDLSGTAALLSDIPATPVIAYQNTDSTVTGTLVETILANLLIPANTMGANDVLWINAMLYAVGTAGAKTFKLYFNTTSNTLAGAINFASEALGAANLIQCFQRRIANKNSVSVNNCYNIAITTSGYENVVLNNARGTLNRNFAVDQYVIVTCTLANTGDTGGIDNIQCILNRIY